MTHSIFISYCHVDEPFKKELENHLSPLVMQGKLTSWSDRQIRAGAPLYEMIQDNIVRADIVLMLISADFLGSDTCQKEMETALKRSDQEEGVAIPIIVRPCVWTGLPIAKLLAGNKDGRPISSAPDRDEAWCDVVTSIGKLIGEWDVTNAITAAGSDTIDDRNVSDAAADELAIMPDDDDGASDRWVYRKEINDDHWEEVKDEVERSLGLAAAQDAHLKISIETRRWGDKIIVDIRYPHYRKIRRLLIADISGYMGYPGYQLEVYPRDGTITLPVERVRWIETEAGERVLQRLTPKPPARFAAHDYGDHLWTAIAAVAQGRAPRHG